MNMPIIEKNRIQDSSFFHEGYESLEIDKEREAPELEANLVTGPENPSSALLF
jgi:hypothetical protein